ncbi:TIGR01777 family protein [Gracilibacillus oryzae]|uniref:TIGR01777 family protein n=1 Tax=Gracilibacillus oryzae TaxID=1672701 RepID=A0A7C8L2E5_9BACI|nr:TIGR01777 family oxidoreductase [Gracilibacillus oryzae]KAB8129379.1 TIGR01777 family protein [Gracilibacillus oryzae]
MKIAITGGTGYVGKNLTKKLTDRGDTVYILTRSPEKYQNTDKVNYVGWLTEGTRPAEELPHLDAIINLAGDSLFGYWTKSKKDRIYQSRINATYEINELIKQMDVKPEVLVSASAVGYFGTSKDETFTEDNTEPGSDFLAEVTTAWEKTALQAKAEGVRTVIARFGVILGSEGALPLMALPFKLYAGGRIGTGDQWLSWIHIKDVAGMIIFAIDNQQVEGPMHVTSPNPVTNKEMSSALAEVLRKPDWLPVPSFILKLFLGEMSILVVKGQKVVPEKAMILGYRFNYPNVREALVEIFK